jgi:hypothetical protein
MQPPSPCGNLLDIQYRHGIRRRRRFAAKDLLVQEKGVPVQRGRDLGHLYADCEGIDCPPRSQDSPPRHQSTLPATQSANVFLTKNGVAKLGDMNVSKVVRKDAMCETQTGTPYYASP